MKELEEKWESDEGPGPWLVQQGKRAVTLTNEFRVSQGKPGHLVWNKKLWEIALVHSKDMCEGRVPFSHHGFDERYKKVNFHIRGFAENVAYNMGVGDPTKVSVDGWINSPGHRANMLGNFNLCAVAIFSAGNKSYFTQLFGLC